MNYGGIFVVLLRNGKMSLKFDVLISAKALLHDVKPAHRIRVNIDLEDDFGQTINK